jgi:NTE family protein
MKSKGIDIVIGVDVEGRLFERDKLNSVLAIMNQIVSYQMYRKSSDEKKKLDVLIHPDIFEFNVVDFDKKDEILKKGNEEAEKYATIFKELAAKQKNKKTKKTLHFNTKKMLISNIKINGSKNFTRAYVLGKLKIKEGDSITKQEITKRIHLLSATKNYNRITYNLTKKTENIYILDFNLTESNDNASLKLGIHYDLLYKSGVLATYTQKKYL